MKSVLIISAQEDFHFPLAEAARKQIYFRAKYFQQSGFAPKILIVTPDQDEEFIHDSIPIQLTTRKGLFRKRWLLRESDQLEYWGTTGLIAMKVGMLGRANKKIFVATDGGVVSTGPKAAIRRMMAVRLASFYNELRVFTHYQKRILENILNKSYSQKITFIKPLVETVPELKISKASRPTLLYMGHLSRFKGVDKLIKLFEDLLPEFPDIQLILCHNGLVYDTECDRFVRESARKYPDSIIIKGKINPFEELAKASILIHPTKQSSGTFAFPLAVWEAISIGTPFITTQLEGFKEYFDDKFLCPNNDFPSLVRMTRAMLSDPEATKDRLTANRIQLEARLTIVAGQYDMSPEVSTVEKTLDRETTE